MTSTISRRIKSGTAVSRRLDFEIRTSESNARLNQCTPGCRTRVYSPVVISLSLTPAATYVLRKGRLINRAYMRVENDVENSDQPNHVDHSGSVRRFECSDSQISA